MENRKDQIVETALKRFSHFGFHKTTMNEIADDLRITKANLYYYYPDKSSLILDVLNFIIDGIHQEELEIIKKYNNNLIDIIIEILTMKNSFMRKYYVLHITENMDWLKGIDIKCTMEEHYERDMLCVEVLFKKAIEAGELSMDDPKEAAQAFTEIIKGVSLLHTLTDVITGIPNEENIAIILASQIRAARLIFEGRIIRNK